MNMTMRFKFPMKPNYLQIWLAKFIVFAFQSSVAFHSNYVYFVSFICLQLFESIYPKINGIDRKKSIPNTKRENENKQNK